MDCSRAMLATLLLLCTALPNARVLYPTTPALTTGTLAVSNVHSLYYQVHGNPNGEPALFLHGGPGAGCFLRHSGFFDPKYYKIVLFDQRGCGKSTPRGELDENDTTNLVADCEALREHLDVEQWRVVLGGSWGSTLALSLALAHPSRVGSLVLRAVCLMRSSEILWLFGGRGVARLQPTGFDAFAKAAEPDAKGGFDAFGQPIGDEDDDDGAILAWYAAALRQELGDDAMGKAAAAWSRWEMSIFGLSSRMKARALPVPEEVAAERRARGAAVSTGSNLPWRWQPDRECWVASSTPELELDTAIVEHALVDGFASYVAECVSVKLDKGEPKLPRRNGVRAAVGSAVKSAVGKAASAAAGVAAGKGGYIPAQARLTSHYSANRAFFESDESILSRIDEIRHIPCIAVQGGNDLVCPPSTAYELHKAWPEMRLVVAPGAGHSMYDPGLLAGVLDATDSFRKLECEEDGCTMPAVE